MGVFCRDPGANLWRALWTKNGVRRVIFCLHKRVKRGRNALGSSAAHRAADRPNAEGVGGAAGARYRRSGSRARPSSAPESPAHAPASRVHGRRGSKRRRPSRTPQAGDSLGRKPGGHTSPRWSADGRHLGCSRLRSPSRGNVGSGPRRRAPKGARRARSERGEPAKLRKERAGRARSRPQGRTSGVRRRLTPAAVVTSERQEVLEPIGLGRSSHRERSRRGTPVLTRAETSEQRPLARDISAGPAACRATRNPSASVKRGGTKNSCAAGDRGVVRGVRTVRRWCSRIVSVAEVDRRRAARRGQERRASGPDAGSSHPARERWGGESVPEAGSAVAKPRDRWRAPYPADIAKAIPWEHLSMEGASGRGIRTP